MTRITLDWPEDLPTLLRQSPGEVAQDIRLAAAIDWYRRGLVSQGRAAELAGLSRVEFIDALAARRIDVVHVDDEDLRADPRRG